MTIAQRDVFRAADRWLRKLATFPPVRVLDPVYQVRPHLHADINTLAQMTSWAAGLTHLLHTTACTRTEWQCIMHARDLSLERSAEKLIGLGLAPGCSGHYADLVDGLLETDQASRHFRLFVFPAEILQHLSTTRSTLQSELLLQSLMAYARSIFACETGSPEQHRSLVVALRLAGRTDLPEYQSWIINHGIHSHQK